MILPIVAYGFEVLRKVSKDITPAYPNLNKLIEDMWETMYSSNGVGLAAPQINRDIRLFVMDTAQMFANMDEEETLEISDDDDEEVKDEEVYLTDSEGRRLCRVRDCDQVSNVEGYCRYHYLLLWKKIQIRKVILIDGKLEKYVEDLTSRYPDKFLEMIRKDLKTEKDFQIPS